MTNSIDATGLMVCPGHGLLYAIEHGLSFVKSSVSIRDTALG